MKIGLQLMQSRGPGAIQVAQEAEKAGFDGLWLADYLGEHANYLKAALLLSATSRLTVGTSIAATLLASPAFHAAQARFLQEISGGRFILGLGSQTKGQIRLELGVDPPKIATMAREALQVIRGILSGQPFDFDGEFQHRHAPGRRLRGANLTPPPVYYSGVGPMNLRIAGEHSDGLLAHPIFTRKYFEEVVWPDVETGLARADKPRTAFTMVAMPMTLIVEHESERASAMSVAKRNLANYFTTHAYGTFMDMHGWSTQRTAIWEIAAAVRGNPARFDWAALEAAMTDDIVEEVCLLGTAAEVRATATERYAGIADYLDFYPMHDLSRPQDEGQSTEHENLLRLTRAFKGFNA